MRGQRSFGVYCVSTNWAIRTWCLALSACYLVTGSVFDKDTNHLTLPSFVSSSSVTWSNLILSSRMKIPEMQTNRTSFVHLTPKGKEITYPKTGVDHINHPERLFAETQRTRWTLHRHFRPRNVINSTGSRKFDDLPRERLDFHSAFAATPWCY